MILDAALGLGAERGYVGTTLALIKERTGLPTSALYWHFESKDDILSDALMHGFTTWYRSTKRWESLTVADEVARDGLAVALLGTLREATRGMDGDPGFWRMGLMLALESGPAVGDGPRARYVKIRNDALSDIEAWWDAAAPDSVHGSADLARLTLATLDGLFLRQQSDGVGDIEGLLIHLAAGLSALATTPEASVWPRPKLATTVIPAPARVPTSRDRLLMAASEVAAESGYEGATISRICQSAGVPASSLYWHFDGKDHLFASVLEHSYAEWAAQQPTWHPPAPGTDWAANLHEMVSAVVTSVAERPAFLRIGLMLLLLRRSEPTPGRDQFIEVRRHRRRHTAAWFLGAGAPPEEAQLRAQLLMAIDDGLLISQMIDTPQWSPAPTADTVAGVISTGL